MPGGPGVRVDAAVDDGDRVPPDYDPLVAKLMVVDHDREAAIDRLGRALDEVEVTGIQTTLPFHRFVAGDESFRAGELSTDWVGTAWEPVVAGHRARALAEAAAAAAAVAVGEAEADPSMASVVPVAGRPEAATATWREQGRQSAIESWPR